MYISEQLKQYYSHVCGLTIKYGSPSLVVEIKHLLYNSIELATYMLLLLGLVTDYHES